MNTLSATINKSASRNIFITIEYHDHKGTIEKLMLKATMIDGNSGIIVGSFDE